jgi:2-oxoglutarate ferredoxin oxidoreductase subunit beta
MAKDTAKPKDDLITYCENTWCPGCGNFGILTAIKNAVRMLEEKGIAKERLFMTAGIGCHGKIHDYLNISGFYSLHGRSMATAQGIKLANPELKVVAFCGDGDAFGEGLEHMLFASKRNADITVIVHDNGVYGLTTGQVTPTSEKGYRGPSTPFGSIEDPLNPLVLMLEAGATFVARGFPGNQSQLTDIIVQAIMHEGFSFVDVLQPCVSYNNTYKRYNEVTEALTAPAKDLDGALAISRRKEKLLTGVIYKYQRPIFHRDLFGDKVPVRDRMSQEKRVQAIKKILKI